MSRQVFWPTSLSGNTITIPGSVYSLDAISVDDINPDSIAFRFDATVLRFDPFVFDINGSEAHDGVDVIRPYDFSSSGFGVWKRMTSPLDAYAPKIISGAPVLGDIRGGNATTSGNVITFQNSSCLDSTGRVQLYHETPLTVTIPSVVNEHYYVFMVKLVADSSIAYRAYASEASVISDTDVSAYRKVSYVRTSSAGVLMPFIQSGDRIDWTTSSKPLLTATTTSGYTSYNPQTAIPVLYESLELWDSSARIMISYDGLTPINADVSIQISILYKSSIYIKWNIGSTAVYISSVKLVR